MGASIPEGVNQFSLRHPHEPAIPVALDVEGRCLVCDLLVERDEAVKELQHFATTTTSVRADIEAECDTLRVILAQVLAACQPVAWTKRPGEPANLKPYWSFLPTDVVEQSLAAAAALKRASPGGTP